MMCTVHNIKKIADFIKKEREKLKDMLKMIFREGSKSWNKGRIRARIANKLC